MRKKLWTTFLLIMIVTLPACGEGRQAQTPAGINPPRLAGLEDTYPVDPIFESFYKSLGGFDVLGPALTPLQESGSLKIQYVEAALLVYDAQAASSERYRLAPLGLVFGIAEPAVENPGVPEERYVNGHVIYADFLPLYQQLGGAQIVGRPLTEARYNPDKARVEQYFENLGFYSLDVTPAGQVQLMSYGAFACDRRCRYQPQPASIPTLRPLLPEPFSSQVAQLGLSFVGKTLSDPYINNQGQLEIIFENLVLATRGQVSQEGGLQLPFRIWLPEIFRRALPESPPQELFRIWLPIIPVDTSISVESNSSLLIEIHFRGLALVGNALAKEEAPQIYARPVVELLGIPAQPPVTASQDPLMVFYPLEDELGHNVPAFFDDYLSRHGGIAISGKPITEVYPLGGGVFEQCFENLCLRFDAGAPQGEQLRPAPLGARYKDKFVDTDLEDFEESQSLQGIDLQVWEDKPFVALNETQVIYVTVNEKETPLMNREPTLILTLPDNTHYEYHFPPTDANGQSSLELEPIPAPNGSLIAYQVCLSVISGDKKCVTDNYLIWNYP